MRGIFGIVGAPRHRGQQPAGLVASDSHPLTPGATSATGSTPRLASA